MQEGNNNDCQLFLFVFKNEHICSNTSTSLRLSNKILPDLLSFLHVLIQAAL